MIIFRTNIWVYVISVSKIRSWRYWFFFLLIQTFKCGCPCVKIPLRASPIHERFKYFSYFQSRIKLKKDEEQIYLDPPPWMPGTLWLHPHNYGVAGSWKCFWNAARTVQNPKFFSRKNCQEKVYDIFEQ